jgi:MSHA pilin protein MshD
MCTRNLARRARGFTLPELLLLIIVLAIALVGVVLVINTATAGSADPLLSKQAMAAAESMMEEVLLQPYTVQGTAPSPRDQTTRASFDDAQDYNGFATTGIYAIDNSATPIPGLEGYNLAVTVLPTALGSVPAADSLRVTVTVTGPRITYVLEGYKLNYP